MATYEQEISPPENVLYEDILQESQKLYQLEQEKLIKEIESQSKKEIIPEKKLTPIEQVVNMGFPIELVLRAYENVGNDPAVMLEYIYKMLD